MKISFIMNVRMPTEKAHGYQIAKMCEALVAEGAQVSLIVPTRKNETHGDVFSYYGVRNNFSVNYVPTFDALSFFRGSRFGFYAQAVSFIWALRRKSIPHDTIIITRNSEIVWWYGQKRYQVFYDAHNFPSHKGWPLKMLLKNATGIITNSRGTAKAFQNAGFTNVFAAPNAVDIEQFDSIEKKERKLLGLPTGRIAMYVGHLYEWKGVGVVIDAARHATAEDLMFVFVGGTNNDIKRYREETKDFRNVFFLGHRLHQDIPILVKSADVLLLPNIPSTQESISYTSPIKMFEYMASGVPIVASNLPSIREVLNENNAILVKPGDPDALLKGIDYALKSGYTLALRARKDVHIYTWDKRARKILEFIKTRNKHALN